MKRFKPKRRLIVGLAIIAGLLVVGGIAVARRGGGEGELLTVVRRGVIEEVRVSGTVEAQTVSDLGFETGGVVREVAVETNDTVHRGQFLASLGLGTLSAQLQSAQAALVIKQSEIANTGINLEAIENKHDTLVKNARIELYSDDLVAEAKSGDYAQAPPVISGRYTGEEGTYKLIIRRGAQADKEELYVFGLEDAEPVAINRTSPTPLGTKGLFVSFPDAPAEYDDTIWFVNIPNTKSPSYAPGYGAYQDALRERDRALEEARAEIRTKEEGSSIAGAEITQAKAEIARIQALIGERMLRAPFAGVVTAVHIDPGESVNSGENAISLISDDGLGVEVDLPEIDSIKVHTGDKAVIVLDAFDDVSLAGTVASVNRTETTVDGVSVYEATIAFDEADERIISGMTADVRIITGEKEDVLAIPVRAITYREDGTPYVTVTDAESDDAREAVVALGLRGSDGFIEVTAGLSEGDTILVPAGTL